MDSSQILITGANGQLGLALQAQFPGARAAGSKELDISDQNSVSTFDWTNIRTIINAAGYTNVDGSETPEGRVAAWKTNAWGVANLVKIAREKDVLLIHFSSDYVFDGTKSPHNENEEFSPLSVYGASKAAGDVVASTLPKYCLIRTTWVVGDGKNFVRTMLELGKKNIDPVVVHDQIGRLTFTSELANAVNHLLINNAAYGVYNVSNDGDPCSWADVARTVFSLAGFKTNVSNTTTAEYFAGKQNIAPRPLNSVFDLSKIQATGFGSRNWHDDLKDYVKKEMEKAS